MFHPIFKTEEQDELQHRYMIKLDGVEYSFGLVYGDLMVKLQKFHNVDIYLGSHLSSNKITLEESGYDYLQEHENGGIIGVCVYNMKTMKMIAMRRGEYAEMDEMITMMQEMEIHAPHLAVVTYPVA